MINMERFEVAHAAKRNQYVPELEKQQHQTKKKEIQIKQSISSGHQYIP